MTITEKVFKYRFFNIDEWLKHSYEHMEIAEYLYSGFLQKYCQTKSGFSMTRIAKVRAHISSAIENLLKARMITEKGGKSLGKDLKIKIKLTHEIIGIDQDGKLNYNSGLLWEAFGSPKEIDDDTVKYDDIYFHINDLRMLKNISYERIWFSTYPVPKNSKSMGINLFYEDFDGEFRSFEKIYNNIKKNVLNYVGKQKDCE